MDILRALDQKIFLKTFMGKEKIKLKCKILFLSFTRIHFSLLILLSFIQVLYVSNLFTTAHPQCGGHSISISTCGVWEVRARVQVSRRELHTHIHLDQDRVEILPCIKKKKKIIQLKPLYKLLLWKYFSIINVGIGAQNYILGLVLQLRTLVGPRTNKQQ